MMTICQSTRCSTYKGCLINAFWKALHMFLLKSPLSYSVTIIFLSVQCNDCLEQCRKMESWLSWYTCMMKWNSAKKSFFFRSHSSVSSCRIVSSSLLSSLICSPAAAYFFYSWWSYCTSLSRCSYLSSLLLSYK